MALAVVGALEKYADLITKPDMTSHLEQDMDQIADGKTEEEHVVKESVGVRCVIDYRLDSTATVVRLIKRYDALAADRRENGLVGPYWA
jgi:DNA topoisomerase-1